MKKLILCASAVAAMTMAGGAFAQSADCARGMSNADPCGVAGVPQPNFNPGDVYRRAGVPLERSSRWFDARDYPYYNYEGDRRGRGNDRDRDGRRDARDNDRDGDGVRNNRDRYPDDRRRH
jgi:hypothetical protein